MANTKPRVNIPKNPAQKLDLASITGISVPVLTVFAASFVFRDKLNLFHLFSLLLMIIGGLALL